MVNITLNTKTRSCIASSTFLGYEGENSANKLIFTFDDEFVDGSAQLNIKRGDENGYVALVRVKETYELEVKSSLVSRIGDVTFQLQVSKSDGTIYKYDAFVMTVKDAIDSDVPLPEDYPTWQEAIATALAEIDNIDVSVDKIDHTTTLTVIDKKGVITEVEIHDGETGPQGERGETGPQGEAGPQGPQGETGETGPRGLQGEKGPKGEKGDKGDVGPQGPKGETGATGPQGPKGEQGPQGIQGEKGADGTITFADLTEEQKASLKGDTGPQGPQGIQGEQGPKGDTGATGPQGPQGEQGPKGDKGDKGDAGETGATGPQGETGPAGADGITPHIGANGNWWIGETDTGVKAEGTGGGGSSSGTKKVTLWEGELKTDGATATLSDSVENYDFILVEASVIFEGKRYAITTNLLDVSTIANATGLVFNIWNAVTTAHYYRLTFGFTDNTTFAVGKATVTSTQWSQPQINKITGIKY